LYEPAEEVVKVLPVAPVFQVIIPPQPLAVRLTLCPVQMVLSASFEVMVGTEGMGLIVIPTKFEVEFPHALEPVPEQETVVL
jgi:hypothetical protein